MRRNPARNILHQHILTTAEASAKLVAKLVANIAGVNLKVKAKLTVVMLVVTTVQITKTTQRMKAGVEMAKVKMWELSASLNNAKNVLSRKEVR